MLNFSLFCKFLFASITTRLNWLFKIVALIIVPVTFSQQHSNILLILITYLSTFSFEHHHHHHFSRKPFTDGRSSLLNRHRDQSCLACFQRILKYLTRPSVHGFMQSLSSYWSTFTSRQYCVFTYCL